MQLASPIIKKIKDNEKSLNDFELKMNVNKNKLEKKIINNYPTVYIHTWNKNDKFEVYVGESNNIFQRTKEHFRDSKKGNKWQKNLNNNDAELYIIGHKHFNKSLTLDIENRLMHYSSGAENIRKVHNFRENPQNEYYTSDEFNEIFSKIWKKLRKYDENLFPIESKIIDSAIFKSSPLHKLTNEQNHAKDLIVSKVFDALLNDKKGQLIFVEGEAGTGKTVLGSSTFYELCTQDQIIMGSDSTHKQKKLKCCLLVNQREQRTVYKQIFKKLCVEGDLVYSPTSFINKFNDDKLFDVVFVDEAHLLLTQVKQSYRGENQLQDILERSKVTVIMFDANQILTTEQYWEYDILQHYKQMAKENDNYIILKDQLRIKANKKVLKWIDDFTKNGIVNKIPKDTGNYEIKIFDTPNLLDKAIISKEKQDNSKLSRLVATYDWEYSDLHKNENSKYWEVKIDNWHKPWNYEIGRTLDKLDKKKIKEMSWTEQPHTINEVGSTFTIHGFDLNYVGVIIGPSVKFRNNRIIFDPKCSCNNKATRRRTMKDGTKREFGEILIKNELRILMTRGINGLYIYACDEELRKHLKNCIN